MFFACFWTITSAFLGLWIERNWDRVIQALRLRVEPWTVDSIETFAFALLTKAFWRGQYPAIHRSLWSLLSRLWSRHYLDKLHEKAENLARLILAVVIIAIGGSIGLVVTLLTAIWRGPPRPRRRT